MVIGLFELVDLSLLIFARACGRGNQPKHKRRGAVLLLRHDQ